MFDDRVQKVDQVLANRQCDLTVLAEQLHKPRNFSAIVRTCDAVGINELHSVAGESGHAIHWRTSQGAEKWVGVREHASIEGACGHLRQHGFQLVAAHLNDEAVDYREIDYTRPTALLIGTELFGVSDQAIALSDQQLTVPMMGMTQSLNVSVACAIVLYEAMRQRAAAGMYGARGPTGENLRKQRFEWLQPKLTRYCRDRGFSYPEMDAQGNVCGDVPRGQRPRSDRN